ncbi:four-carbon acid sugar kinase family protein [Microbacterium aerolatum]|uniref:four-carbon acid sugar kinase family protein n=1 Tax=Microbacterium aerolatum TaxID=153731 RepID=UPI00384D240D
MQRSAADVVLIADDLSGAAESAAALLHAEPDVPVHLLSRNGAAPRLDPSKPAVIDTNSRTATASELPRLLDAIRPALDGRDVVVRKVDSLLRGHFAAETEWMLGLGRPVLFAPALPSAGRTVRQGRVLVDGVPLAETSTWAIESARAPETLLKSFSVPTQLLSLDLVRAEPEQFSAAIAEAPGMIVCDAESTEDLRRIAAAALSFDEPPVLVGAGALVFAVAEELAPTTPSALRPAPMPTQVSFVIGTAEPGARRQVHRLETAGATVLRLSPNALLDGGPALRSELAHALAQPVSVVTFDHASGFDPAKSAELAGALAQALDDAAALSADTSFILSGGQTARAVLDQWGARTLTIYREIDRGTAQGLTDGGIPVITRPGSFGDADSLVRIARELSGSTASNINFPREVTR